MPEDYTQIVDEEPIIEVETDEDEFVELPLEDEGTPEPPKQEKQTEAKPKGDLTIALRKERDEKRELAAQLRQAKELISQLASNRPAQQDKQPDPIADVLSQLEGDDYDPKMLAVLKTLGAQMSRLSSKTNDDSVLELRIQQLENKYPDAAEYRDEIASLVKSGLAPEKAYYAAAGANLVTKSRDDILREAEILQSAAQSGATVSGEGNGAPTPIKQRATIKIKKSDADYLQSQGISVSQYARLEKMANEGLSIDAIRSTIGKAGSKKG